MNLNHKKIDFFSKGFGIGFGLKNMRVLNLISSIVYTLLSCIILMQIACKNRYLFTFVLFVEGNSCGILKKYFCNLLKNSKDLD